MKKYLLGVLSAIALSAQVATQAYAEQPQLRDEIPATHTVVKGDTLWDISATFLKNPWMWPEIWHVNAQIENPHLIYPGDVIRLIYVDGKPRLTLDTSGRVYKMSPQARVLSAEEAIETIPLEKINSFLSRSRVVGENDFVGSPYVLSGLDQHLLVGAGDKIYGRGEFGERGTVYGVYRQGEIFKDPQTKEILGVQALDIATASLLRVEDDNDDEDNIEIGTLSVSRTTEEVRIGDRFLRQEERPIDSTFFPSAPSMETEGVILAVEGGLTQVGKMDVVVINRGEREGMTAGTVLAVYKRGGIIRDRVSKDRVTLPDERAGVLMIFRTFEKVSFGLILEAERGISVQDKVRNP